jgi:peptidoglycan/LPS O-acetylase OafA/YrhL
MPRLISFVRGAERAELTMTRGSIGERTFPPETPPVAFTGYMPFIDGLRAVAVIAVVLCHAGMPGFAGGYVGVDVFFVISGFLIIGHIRAEQARGDFSVYRFYARRTLRILPVYFAMLIAVLIAAPFFLLSGETFESFAESFALSPLMASNIQFLNEQGYFDLSAQYKPLLHTWTLAVEEQFYLVVPLLLVWFAHKARAGHRHIHLVAALFIMAGSFVGALFLTDVQGHNFSFYLMPLRAWEFVAGGLIVPAVVGRLGRLPVLMRHAGAILGMVMIVYAIVMLEADSPWPGWLTLLPVGGAVLVIAFCLDAPSIPAARLLASRPAVAIGLISYSWYLWHWPILSFSRLLRLEPSLAIDLLSSVVGGLALAVASYRFIELPVKARRGELIGARPDRVFWRGVGAAVVLAAVGGGGASLYSLQYGRSLDTYYDRDGARVLETRCDIDNRHRDYPDDCFSGDYVLGIGDSHMGELVPALAFHGRQEGHRFVSVTEGGCPADWFIPALEPGIDNRPARCESLARPLADLGSSPDQPRGVIISFYWSSLEPWELDELVGQFEARNTRVLLLGLVPVFDHPAPTCLELVRRQNMSAEACAVERKRLEEEFSQRNSRLKATAERHSMVRFVNPMDAFCDHLVCRPNDGRRLFYADRDHLTGAGTHRLIDAFADDFAWVFGG